MANLPRRDRRRLMGDAGARATQMASLAANDPIEVARQLSASRDQIKAAYTMCRYLLKQLGGGPVTIPKEYFGPAAPDGMELRSEVDAEGNARVWLERRG